MGDLGPQRVQPDGVVVDVDEVEHADVRGDGAAHDELRLLAQLLVVVQLGLGDLEAAVAGRAGHDDAVQLHVAAHLGHLVGRQGGGQQAAGRVGGGVAAALPAGDLGQLDVQRLAPRP